MEQIIIHKPDGTSFPLQSRKNVTKISKAEQRIALLNEDIVSITVETPLPQNYEIGDRIIVFGREYILNLLPSVKKRGTRLYNYDLTFEGVQYQLARAQYEVTTDTTGAEAYGDALMGDLRRFMEILIKNVSRVMPGKWKLGNCPTETEDRNMIFSCENCLAVLQRLCQEFEQEFEIEQSNGINTIHVHKAGTTFPFPFQYGKGRGVYELTRQLVSTSNIVNRLKIFGANKNLSTKYHNDRLCLPGKTKAKSYLEDTESMLQYGVWEDTKNFEKIYPRRIGKITASAASPYKFIDDTMFDLNEKDTNGTIHLIDGVAAKIHFNTGGLAGYEFDVHGYNHATRMFTLKPFTDERGIKFPSETSAAFQPKPGDEYVLLDISLPKTYIEEAEALLLEEGKTYLTQNCQPKVQYGLTIEQSFLVRYVGQGSLVNIFAVGDYLQVTDSDLSIDKSIRITAFTRDLLNPYKYSLTISDAIEKSIYNRIISELNDIDRTIQINDLADPAKARRRWVFGQELLGMIFDPEGNYYTEHIKPGSIETQMLAVGAKSMQFMLQNTLFEANYNGNQNLVKVTGGVLTHYTIEDAIRNWNLATATTTLPGNNNAFYIYAKCQRIGTAGTVIFSTTQIRVNDDPGFYHFWIGVIHSVVDEVRAISLTYGSTTINGKFIRTGQIESSDGTCFINLDGNSFRIGSNKASLDWNTRGDGVLRLKGSLIQSPSGDENVLPVFRGSFSSFVLYYKGDEITYNGSLYRCLQDCPTAGIMPINATYWHIEAQKGEKGDSGPQGVAGAKGADGKTTYTWIRYADNASGGGISNSPTAKLYIGFAYNKATPTESNTPTDYTWSLIQGPQGNTGVAGPPGTNGQATYTWIKYSDNANGDGLYDVPKASTKYIGIAPNKATAAESNTPTHYTWSLFKGEDGKSTTVIFTRNQFTPATPTGAAPAGWTENALSLANNFGVLWKSFGTKDINGNLVAAWSSPTMDEPYTSNYLERFTWSNGQGSTGIYAQNGKTSENVRQTEYTPFGCIDVAWVGHCDGVNQSATSTEADGGFEVTVNNIDPTKPLRFSCWFIKGSNYGHMYFGCGWGLTLDLSNVEQSNPYFASGALPSLNKWYLLVGFINGSKDLSSTNNPLGGFYDPETGKKVGGIFQTFKNKQGVTSQVMRAYNFYCEKKSAFIKFWNPRIDLLDGREPGIQELLKKGAQGEDGQQGAQGATGPQGAKGSDGFDGAGIVFRGEYSASAVYYGNASRLDIVKYNGIYYKAKRTAGAFNNVLPTNMGYWENFGAQFESIATNLLLAEGASIGNWSIQSGKIVSTLGQGNKISLDASASKIQIDSSYTGGQESSGGAATLRLDASGGLMEARNSDGVSYVSAGGIFSNSANTNAVAASLGVTRKAAIVGLGWGNISNQLWENENFIAGVYGTATNRGKAPAYGGFFQNLMAAGLFLKTRAINESTSSTYLTTSDSLVIGYSGKQQVVYLPNDGVIGRTIFFKQWWRGYMRVYAYGGQTLWDDSTSNAYFDIGEGWGAIFVFTIGNIDGVKKEAWLYNKYKF